jgi:hypothetical protein
LSETIRTSATLSFPAWAHANTGMTDTINNIVNKIFRTIALPPVLMCSALLDNRHKEKVPKFNPVFEV